MTSSEETSTIVVGAGIAGLYAAYLLKAQGKTVKLLEARPIHGGRVASIRNWADYPIELGAAFVHGRKQDFYELAKLEETKLDKVAHKPYFYHEGKLHTLREALRNKKLKKINRFFNDLYKYDGVEQSVTDYLSTKKYATDLDNIILGFGYEYGTDVANLGLGSLSIDERMWHSGEEDYVSPRSFMEVIDEFYQPLIADIQLNTVVKEINYTDKEVQLTDEKGNHYTCDQVIVTVPLSVLKKEIIQFIPALPQSKIVAIERLGFDVGMKVFLKFNQRFWPEDMTALYGGTHCPLYETAGMGRKTDIAIMSAYVMGEKAAILSQISRQEARDLLLAELDELFGEELATTHFQDFILQDWGKEPYIWGAYSYASIFSAGMRESLAQPLQKRLYFAGEATHFDGHNSTLHGAMESAEWAVNDIIEATKPSKKEQKS